VPLEQLAFLVKNDVLTARLQIAVVCEKDFHLP